MYAKQAAVLPKYLNLEVNSHHIHSYTMYGTQHPGEQKEVLCTAVCLINLSNRWDYFVIIQFKFRLNTVACPVFQKFKV